MVVRGNVSGAVLDRLDGDRLDSVGSGVDGVGDEAIGRPSVDVLGGEKPDLVGVLGRLDHVGPVSPRPHRLHAGARVRVGEPDLGERAWIGGWEAPPTLPAPFHAYVGRPRRASSLFRSLPLSVIAAHRDPEAAPCRQLLVSSIVPGLSSVVGSPRTLRPVTYTVAPPSPAVLVGYPP